MRSDAPTEISRLGGMQAQHPPSPYIGLWSRLVEFDRTTLESAVMSDRVLKATLMRGTLHLVAAGDYSFYRAALRSGLSVYEDTVKAMRQRGVDVEGLAEAVRARLREAPMARQEVRRLASSFAPQDLPDWAGYAALAVGGGVIHSRENALFGFQPVMFRLGPEIDEVPPSDAWQRVITTYLRAFGPATRGDLAQWSGQPVGDFAGVLEAMDLRTERGDDGRSFLDLPDAPLPGAETPAPVRFLPKWDNVLLAYDKRDRILPEPYRKIVIRKNGDVLPTFLVDGFVAGSWDAPLRGRAVMTLTALSSLDRAARAEVEAEGERLLAWLRPETDRRGLAWAAA